MPRRFWLPRDHATALAEQQLLAFGWEPTGGAGWDLAWTLDSPPDEVFAHAERGHLINHVRGSGVLTLKSHLCVTLREAAARAAAAGVPGLIDFAPETLLLPEEWDAWTRRRSWDPDAIWIQKPAGSSRGRGVALVTDPGQVRNGNLVVQRYVADPHLIDGFKYSLRFYVLIAGIDPLIAYVCEDGFTKLASRPFSLDAGHRDDRFRHLTNPDVLRDDPEAAGVSTRNTTHRRYRDRLQRDGIDTAALWARIHRMLAAALAAAQPALRAQAGPHRGGGQFELLGVDVALDAALKPYLIECNLSPSLSVEASAHSEASRDEHRLKTEVVHDTLRLIGADADDPPLHAPAGAADARARLAWHDARRGGFTRLWPSAAALACLAAAVPGPLDAVLLEDEAQRQQPDVAVNGVAAAACGNRIFIVDGARDRLSLLDADESAWWRQPAGAPPPGHAVEWLRQGWLAPRDLAAPALPPAPAAPPRRRSRWNRERVYAINGCRIAIICASPDMETAVDAALGWWQADADEADATFVVRGRGDIARLLRTTHRLALARRDGVVRRPLALITVDAANVLDLEADAGEGVPVTIGGSPFGAWVDRGGAPQWAAIDAIATRHVDPADVVFDLLADGPGVVRAAGVEAIAALSAWVQALPLVVSPSRRS